MVAQVQGGGWGVADFAPDGRTRGGDQYISVTKSNLYLLDLATGRMTPIGDHSRDIAYGGAEFAPDGTLWVTSDEGSDFQRLGTARPRDRPLHAGASPNINWDVENFDISDDGRTIAFVTNEAGISRLRLLDTAHRRGARLVGGLPAGTIGGARDRALGRDRPQPDLGAQPVRRLFGRSADAGGDALDAERDGRARRARQCRAGAGRGEELRRRDASRASSTGPIRGASRAGGR